MELGEFIRKSVERIVGSIAEVRKNHPDVNAENQGLFGELGHLLQASQYGMFTRVDFDLAVVPGPDGMDGGTAVFVFGDRSSIDRNSSATTSRISFSVPIRLPQTPEANRSD